MSKRREKKWGSQSENHRRNKNYFAYFPFVLSRPTLSTEVILFLLPRAVEIKDSPIQRSYSRTDLDKKKSIIRF